MNETSLEEYRKIVEAQAQDLLSVVQSVASGDLNVEVPIPSEEEGIEVLTELAAGVDRMVEDLRAMMAEQERARAEVESSRLQLAATLKELLAVQRRYLEERWDRYTSTATDRQGYYRYGDEDGPTAYALLPAMTTAVLEDSTVTEAVRSLRREP
jgi:HAMP domain-containing protein